MSSRKSENIQRIDEIYDDELWRAHEMSRTRLIRICRELLRQQYERRNAPRKVLSELEGVLDPETLTIAVARRFATYKRADLLLEDANRLASLINNTQRPVQSGLGPFRVGEHFRISTDVNLGRLAPQEVDVELYCGHMRSVDRLQDIAIYPMVVDEPLGAGHYRYWVDVPCGMSGRFGFSIRVTPRGDSALKYDQGLITWV